MTDSTAFGDIVGEDLSGVTFVRDYLQLQFNPPPLLSAFTPVTVRCAGRVARLGEAGFADLILAQIGKYVGGVDFREGEALLINFEDHSQIAVSLRPEDYVAPEAMTFADKDNVLLVV